MANANRNLRLRNEYLEKQIKNIEKLYYDYKKTADARILELGTERDKLNDECTFLESKNGIQKQMLVKLKSRNWWQRLIRKFE